MAAGPLQHEVALVTGATLGIGEAIARRFAAEGARVAVVGRDARRGNAVVAGIAAAGGRAAFFAADVTHDAAVRDLIADVLARFGDLSILVNNAGRSVPGTVVNTTAAEWEEVWRVNVSSAFLTSHHAVPRLLERGGGCVVHIASEVGLKGLKERAADCAAKAAIMGLAKAMAVDHSPRGVRVNCICPDTVEAPMVAVLIETHAAAAMKDAFLERRLTPYLGTPEDIAEAALYMAVPRNRYLTCAGLAVDGGSLAR